MNILVIGSNSFLAKEIKNFFNNHNFKYINRNDLDLDNKLSVNNYFSKNTYDIIINTCVVGGKRDITDNYNILVSNLNMFNNLLDNKNKFGYLFNFCSGAAFDRRLEISNISEIEIFNRNPIDYYGLSKNIIARESINHKKIYNFRIFGCFGLYESSNRFITNSLNNIKNNKSIIINKEKKIDFVSAYDLCLVLEYYINNIEKELFKDINIVYKNKYFLSDIAKKIIDYTNSENHATMLNNSIDKEYTGSSQLIDQLPIRFNGLEQSLKEIINVKLRE